ncbi:cytidylate kinase [Candidatus Filomicrobium marinum]|uniref:Cytidylate kinase n=2 Tax=Filomicrobium TaxID=119044 RepID=A0A0D6JF87_9HYPH|nr:cytidylate kinase [Candidatus Filomicrobium marinum]
MTVMIIAIDGPAASGKGTLARRLAAYFGYHYLDTGLLYRAVARDCLELGHDLNDTRAVTTLACSLDPVRLDDAGLRAPGIGEAASIVAKIPEVRAALLEYQRSFANRLPGAILDGRDIGTVVCPDADAKIFVTASVEERAKRRFREYEAAGESPDMEKMLELIRARDARDAGRGAAPMRRAEDADLLDTTEMDIETAFDAAVGLIKRKIGQ